MVEGRQLLQNAATAAGNGTPLEVGGAGKEHAFYIQATGTVTAGAVTLETARSAGYTGTWQSIGNAITPVTNSVIVVSYSGVLLAVRARISTAVTGGATVTVEYVSNS